MQTLIEEQRVIVKANPDFRGVVTRVAYDGAGGFVRMDSAKVVPRRRDAAAESSEEIYYSAQELDPEL